MTELEKQQEREANIFAIALLMPPEFIHRDMEGHPPLRLDDDPRIRQMARRYNVTEQMMTTRLVNLGYLT